MLKKRIAIWLLTWMIVIVSSKVEAHQPDVSSTILAQKDNATWILEIRAALTAFKYEVELEHGKDAYSNPEQFKSLILDHIQEHVRISTNKKARITLVDGVVRLGHETSTLFNINGLEEFQTLEIINKSFENIPRNQSALVVLKKGFQQDQFVFSKKNNHTIKLNVKDNSLVLSQEKNIVDRSPSWLIPSISLISMLVFSYYVFWYFERS